MNKFIRGSKGGSRSREPVRAEDTLDSKEFATIQDLLSEGEIEGWATPSKKGITRNNPNYAKACLADIFLDDTAVINVSPDDPQFTTKIGALTASDYSFQDVTFIPKFGESNQKPVPNLANATLNKLSNTILTNSAVVTTSVPVDTPNLTVGKHAVEVTVQFQALQKFETNGDILGTEVNYQIQLQTNNGPFQTLIDETIKGRSKDSYSREHVINLPNAIFGSINYTQAKIKVVRVTADSNVDEIQDVFIVSRVEEIVYTPQAYPDCAYSTLRVSAEQFRTVPKRAFRIRGIKVNIPGAGANGTDAPTVDPATGRIVYDENYIFNGTMGAAVWTTCPAMILLDLLTNQRYGLGVHISPDQSTIAKKYENIDLFSYVQASIYANEEITLLDNTKEARFACNVCIQGTADAYTAINELSGIMRAFPIWQTGSITITQDRPLDSVYLFSLANVGEGGFSYQGSSLKQRHSVISVGYFNMDSREIDYEVFEDTAAINKFGIVKKTIKAFGCTSRSQAMRLAKAVLFSEQQESEMVSFTTSIDAGIVVRPGNIISISDPVRSVERRSGRIKTATTTAITVDNSQDLATYTGIEKTLSVILPDGKMETKDVVLGTGGITNNHTVINVSSAFSQAPSPNSIWMLSSKPTTGESGVQPQTFRVITVEEQDGVNYAITALTYVPGKYDNIEKGDALPERFLSLLNQPRNPPSNLSAEEVIVTENNLAIVKLILSWSSVSGVNQYQVQYRFNNTNWIVEDVFRPDFEIKNTAVGTYEFKVFSYNSALKLSDSFSFLSFQTAGKTAPPSDVQNLTIEPVTNKLVRLRWSPATDPDVIHGGKVYVRHSSREDGSGTFQNSVDLIEALAGNTTDAVVPALDGEYILKFRDDQGNFSQGETSIILDLPDLIDAQQIIADREDIGDASAPAFSGDVKNVSVVADALQLTNPAAVKTGTYSQSGTTITVTSSSHGIEVGEILKFNFIGGKAVTGEYTIVSVPNQNTLTVTSSSANTTSGNVSIDRGLRGTYDFATVLDCEAIFSLNLKRLISVVGFAEGGQTITATYVRTTATISGQSQTVIEITKASHGITVGEYINFAALTGGATNGVFEVIAVTTNTFQFLATGSAISSSNCTYAFINTIDQLIPAGSLWDDYAPNGNFDGPEINDTNASISVSTTNDDPSSNTAVFTPFNAFANGTYKARGFKFRVTLTSEDPAHNVAIQRLGIIADFESRTERNYIPSGSSTATSVPQNHTSSMANGLDVTFANPFFVGTANLGGLRVFKPAIGITIMNAAGGEYFTIKTDTNGDFLDAAGNIITGTGFNISIRDANNTPINKQFTFQAVGYGKGV